MSSRSNRFVAGLLLSGTGSVFGCATCGCSLSSDAAMGYSAEAGWRASLQFDYIDQSQLRFGSHSISASQVAAINNAGGDQEVEHDTVNRYFTFGLSYSPDAVWNFRVLLPYIDRGHSTYGSSANPLTPDDLSTTRVQGLGDVRLLATWQGLLPDYSLGLQVGIKLPTGHYGGPNADGTGIVGHDPTSFKAGPLAGDLVDTSLQAGTGSTDVLLGAFFRRPVSKNFDAFANFQFQSAFSERLDSPGADFRPGNTTFLSFGTRYAADPALIPQLQVNISHKSADQGALADNPDSAGTVVYLSPGATWSPTPQTQLFAFVQLPVYSHLIGYQLAPRWTSSLGVSVGF